MFNMLHCMCLGTIFSNFENSLNIDPNSCLRAKNCAALYVQSFFYITVIVTNYPAASVTYYPICHLSTNGPMIHQH